MALYEWDSAKYRINLEKHQIAFEDVEDFDWETALFEPSTRHGEERWVALGYILDRLHTIVFTYRGDTRRIISLRKSNTGEKRKHERLR